MLDAGLVPALLMANTLYHRCVSGGRSVWVCEVPDTVVSRFHGPVALVLTSTLKLSAPETAFHEICIAVVDCAVAVTPVGAAGI